MSFSKVLAISNTNSLEYIDADFALTPFRSRGCLQLVVDLKKRLESKTIYQSRQDFAQQVLFMDGRKR